MTSNILKNTFFVSSKISDGNMSSSFGEKEEVFKNQAEFLKKQNINSKNLIIMKLEHKDNVVFVSKKNVDTNPNADAMVTNDKNIFLGVLTADCMPIGIFDPENNILALVHASRHNINKIISNTIALISNKLGSKQKKLLVRIGPFIHNCHYDIDLEKTARNIFERNGVVEENIKFSKNCTYEDHYLSHRRSAVTGELEGRLLTIAGFN